ncbi:E3 ubiquitin/ISG15 ligase TRIM25-like [Epinephelus lanceolatus]
MAERQQPERGVDLDQSQFCCAVCLDLLKEPVTIPCGHSYCKICIECCWNEQERRGRYSCPQCRETFNPRPVLRRNNMLAEVVEMIKRTGTQLASARAIAAGPSDVACDFCHGTSKNKATMSCLTCLASYCPVHLEPHHSVPVLKKHQLVSATIPLQEKMCTKHNKLTEVYCGTDKKCICYLCDLDEHKGHDTVSAAAERAEEQKQLIVSQKKVQERFQKREKELNELLQAVKDLKSCSRPAVKSCDKIFDELISSIKRQCTVAKQLIKAQEQTAVAQADELQQQLEEEIASLKRRDIELDWLSQTDDHIHFIQTFQSLSNSCESPDLPPGVVARPKRSTKAVTKCVSKMRDDIESLLKDTLPRISATVSTIDVALSLVPKTREEFLCYCHPLTLDVNSVSQNLSLSQGYQWVENKASDRPAHSERFTSFRQVLCREGLSERCYWEVSLNGTWSVAVSYKDINRSSEFGQNNKSWSLECSIHGYTFRHNKRSAKVSGPQSSRIGVYLDYEAGTLSFYSISHTMTLLHKEHTTFTQPLYPGLGLKDGDSWMSRGHCAELIKIW